METKIMKREQLFKEIKDFTQRQSNGNIVLTLGLSFLSEKANNLLSQAVIYDRKQFPKSSKKQLLFYKEYLLPILSHALYYNEHLIATQKTPTNPSKKNNFFKKRVKKYTAFASLNNGDLDKLDALLANGNYELIDSWDIDAPQISANNPFYPFQMSALVSSLPSYLVFYGYLTVARKMISIHNDATLLSLLDKFAWKGKYNTLAIFIYNLYRSGSLGDASFKKHEFITFFSLVFSCDFSNVYHQSIYDLQTKKIAPTPKE